MAEALQRIITNRYGGRDLPVTLVLPDGARVPLSSAPAVEIVARSWRGLHALASPAMGSLARAYVHGDIDFTGSARRVLGIAESMVGAVTHGRDRARTKWRLFLHQRRSNRRNIAHHYDVSNAFYRIWLDQRMVYSCAYFRADADTLDAAQVAKLDHICRKLRLAPGERFLDIGCGWGALLFHAAERYGVRGARHHAVAEPVRPRAGARSPRADSPAACGWSCATTLDLPEDAQFDKIASVGMFEHVGVRRFDRYFGKIYRVLTPGGMVLNHGITHNSLDARQPGQRHRRLRRRVRVSRRRADARRARDRGHGAAGARTRRRRGAARALREDAVAWVDRLEAREDEARARGRRRALPRLAHLHGGFGARVRPRLAVAVAAARRQGDAPTAGCRIR